MSRKVAVTKEFVLASISQWQDLGIPMSDEFETKFIEAGWRWEMWAAGEWVIEKIVYDKADSVTLTKRDWEIHHKGETQVLLDEALIRIKHLEERLLNEVPRSSRDMGQ